MNSIKEKLFNSNLKVNLSKCVSEIITDMKNREEEFKTYFNLNKEEFKVILKLFRIKNLNYFN